LSLLSTEIPVDIKSGLGRFFYQPQQVIDEVEKTPRRFLAVIKGSVGHRAAIQLKYPLEKFDEAIALAFHHREGLKWSVLAEGFLYKPNPILGLGQIGLLADATFQKYE
jgi:hypothetical protein